MTTDTIRQLLSHPDGYRRDAWRDFLKALFPTAEIFAAPQPVTHPGEELPDGFQLGRAMLSDSRRIAFIEQPVPASTNLMRNRVGLRNRIARLIDQESATGVHAIFTDAKDRNFRLSFVARESSLTFTDEGTQTTKTETAPKRFTYYLGPDEACTTAAQRFELLLRLGAAASLPDLIDAFSVEKLNKEFFNDFSRRVSDIAAELKTTHPDWTHDTCRTEAQTLLNRLVFLYFVQRKGWLNRSRTFLTDAFKPHTDQPGCTFFRSFLGPLFECLSTEPSLAPTFPHDVPFLNGGLFSDEAGADDPDIQRRRSLDVSNAVFRTVFQDLLDRYNFTIVEDSPSSVEVAIDPEMLGRVFEALVLQREESDTGGKSRRHDTGSHYTPRPIVHYLCREALAGWLENQPPFSGQPDARLRINGLLALDASEGLDEASQRKLEKLLTAEEAAALARLLLALRMCDPAVGSGAFPLGFLHEMLNVIRLCETRSRGQDPAEGDPTWLYETKKQIIEQVIYGVDLQVPAIELCKLRLWLSLMVDHELKADPFKCSQTLSTPPKLADGTYFPRLLVLDDILISLDMAHRRPLLEILNEKFADWQVILLTHDRAWYEMAKTQLRPGKWKCMEMFAVPFGDYERPLIKEDVNHLERARNFLADGEIKAAAVHVRTKFELVLKEACRELRLRVVYVDDPKRWDANHFWDIFQARLKPDPASPQPSDAGNLKLIADVSHSLSWVLNPHSHSRPVDHIRLEIQKAVESVAELERMVKKLILSQKDLALQKATIAQTAATAALAALSSP